MSKEKDLAKNTAIVTIGKISTQMISFFLLPLYTAVLSTDEYGIVDLLTTLVSFLLPVITLQIEQGVFRFLIDCRENEEEKRTLISTTLLSLIAQCIIYVLIFIGISNFINNDYKYFLLTNVIACIFSSVMLQISRGLGDNVRYTKGSFITSITTIIFNVLFLAVFRLGANGMLVANLFGNILCSVYLIFSKKIYKYIKIRDFNFGLLKKLWRYSLPLVPNMVSWWIVNVSDRLIIAYFMGSGMNGIYSVSNKFSGVLSTLYSVFNMTWTEAASININTENRDQFFNNILDFVIRIFGSLCIGIVAFMPLVFNVLVNENFEEAYYQIPILILSSMFYILVSFQGAIYVACKRTSEIAKTSMFSAIINIVANLIGIQLIGLYAASISTFVSYFIMFLYRNIDSRKYVNLKFSKKLVSTMSFVSVIVLFTYYLRNIYVCIVVAISVIFFTAYINKNSAKEVLKIVKNKLYMNKKV